MSVNKTKIDLKDLDDLLCKYAIKDLDDLESRLDKELSLARRIRCGNCKHLEEQLKANFVKCAKIRQEARNELIDDIIAIGTTKPLYVANKHSAYKMLIIDTDELNQLRNKENK